MQNQKLNFVPGNFFLVPNRLLYRKLKPTAKLVYIALCDYANEAGNCYPSRKTIAADVDVSVKTIDRALKQLVEAGLIEKRERKTELGDRTSNFYQLMDLGVEGSDKLSPRGGTQSPPSGSNVALTIPTEQEPVNTPTNVGEAEPQEFGDPTINQMLKIFEEHNGVKLRNVKKQRNAASRIIKRCGGNSEKAVGICTAALACQSEKYAPTIANLLDLDEKLDKLAAYYRKRNAKSPTVNTGVVV